MILSPGQIWSLWEMRKFSVGGVVGMANVFAVWRASEASVPREKEARERNTKAIKRYLGDIEALQFTAAAASLKKIMLELDRNDYSHERLVTLTKEFEGRFVDEAREKQFFSLSHREAEIHQSPRTGWELGIQRFPNTIDDVEEASKCFALSRYPAAIFHSLQIVEAALIELGKFLKVKDPKSGWTAVSAALAKALKKDWKEKSRFERKNHAFLEQVQGTVEGLKNAWRNKISHVDGRLILITKEFSPEVAEEILFATRAFVRRLAEGLPPPKGKAAA